MGMPCTTPRAGIMPTSIRPTASSTMISFGTSGGRTGPFGMRPSRIITGRPSRQLMARFRTSSPTQAVAAPVFGRITPPWTHRAKERGCTHRTNWNHSDGTRLPIDRQPSNSNLCPCMTIPPMRPIRSPRASGRTWPPARPTTPWSAARRSSTLSSMPPTLRTSARDCERRSIRRAAPRPSRRCRTRVMLRLPPRDTIAIAGGCWARPNCPTRMSPGVGTRRASCRICGRERDTTRGGCVGTT
mmetsp:Transcript_1499/g.3256  ORF Transcript_1499/g.3256 Transcript_1499/m.3256 type:complete len:243 (+) Transcript_1499:288-1016(+)